MAELDNRLLVSRLRTVVSAAADGAAPGDDLWTAVVEVKAAHAWEDASLDQAIESRDIDTITARLAEWDAGKQPLPPSDRAIMKRAYKAFRKRMKLQRLDDESRLGGGPFSQARQSSVVAILPPAQYPADIWQELAIQGRLRDADQGFYELVEE